MPLNGETKNADAAAQTESPVSDFDAELRPRRLWELLEQLTAEKLILHAELRAVMYDVFREAREQWEEERRLRRGG